MTLRMTTTFQRCLRGVAIAARAFRTALPAIAAPFAYVPNQKSGTISVIDTATDTVTQHALGRRHARQAPAGDRLGRQRQTSSMSSTPSTTSSSRSIPPTDAVKHSVDIGEDAEGVRLSPIGRPARRLRRRPAQGAADRREDVQDRVEHPDAGQESRALRVRARRQAPADQQRRHRQSRRDRSRRRRNRSARSRRAAIRAAPRSFRARRTSISRRNRRTRST